MEYKLLHIHIGSEISKKLEASGMTKSEFGRRIGVQQQHVNRILDRDTIDLKRLLKICEVLDCNFFAMFCDFQEHINAYNSAVALRGPAKNYVGDAALALELELATKELDLYKNTDNKNDALVAQQEAQLKDKQIIIDMLREQIQELKSRL